MTAKQSAPCPSLADDVRQAQGLLVTAFGTHRKASPVLLMLGALWLAVHRLCQVVQTSASSDDWTASEAGTLAKGEALGIDARLGESLPDYRARLALAIKSRGQG